ncbi:MAG: hypothetical protein ACOYON_16510 [Fimbriimonas sp.]
MKPTWYERSCQIIGQVIAENPGASDEELRALVSDAYPFGQRKMWPYKAWLKAVNDLLPKQLPTTVGLFETDKTSAPLHVKESKKRRK